MFFLKKQKFYLTNKSDFLNVNIKIETIGLLKGAFSIAHNCLTEVRSLL